MTKLRNLNIINNINYLLHILQLPSVYKNNSLIFNLTYLLMVVSTFLFNSGLIYLIL
jgi:hypothetical protein